MVLIKTLELDETGNYLLINLETTSDYIRHVYLYPSKSYLRRNKPLDLSNLLNQSNNKELIIYELEAIDVNFADDLFVLEVIDNVGNKRQGLVGNLNKVLYYFIQQVSNLDVDCDCKIEENCNVNFEELSYIQYFITILSFAKEEKEIKDILYLYNNIFYRAEQDYPCYNPAFTISTINNKTTPKYV